MLRTMFRFDEPASVAPSDELGGVADLEVVGGFAAADLVDGVLGRALDFQAGAAAYEGTDAVTGATLHTRDVSVQVVMRWQSADQGSPGVVVCRGIDGSAAERYAYGLELRRVADDVGELRWFWATVAGVLKTQVGGHFKVASDSAYIMLTATRRWVSPTEVELRYYAGADLLAEVLSVDGDIGGGTAGTMSIGARRTDGAPPTWGDFLWGSLDELAIFDHALCAEEVEATWRRITEHQPHGAELLRDLAPPGAPISADPSSRVQRFLRLIGEGLGFAAAKGEEVRQYTLPDRSFGARLARWEGIARQPSRPRDPLEIRRRRVISHLRSRGLEVATVREALREVLDLHPSQIEILNFSNDYTDDFTALREERWSVKPGPSTATISVAPTSGVYKLEIHIPAGQDTRWLGGSTRRAPRCRIAVENGRGFYFGAKMATTWSTDVEAGFVFEHGSRGDRMFFGVRNTVGVFEVVVQRWRANVLVDATPVVLGTTTSGPHWLRIRPDPVPGLVGAGETQYRLEWSTDGVTFDHVDDVVWIYDHQWAGFYVRGTDASNFADVTAKFDEWLMRLPFGTRPFRWYAYRDLTIAGVPDMDGANALLKRLRHAYTQAAAITTRSLLCDDEASGCDLGPMGGF